MPFAITSLKPSFSVDALKLQPEMSGLTMKPLGIVVGPLRDPMADLKRDAAQAVATLFAGFRAGLPALTR